MVKYLSDWKGLSKTSPYYAEESFTSKLSSAKDWNVRVQDGAYTMSGLFTKYLIDRFSIGKILNLLENLDRNFYEPAFREKFKKIIGVDLSEAEKDFLEKFCGSNS